MALGCESKPYREVAVNLDAAPAPGADTTTAERPTLRFAVAAVESPRDTHLGYAALLERLADRLGEHVELVQRRTYHEVNELLITGRLDVALLCTGGWLDLRRRSPGGFEVLAAPRIDGQTTYSSIVLVPAASPARGVFDLAGKSFAFTDELSFSGRAYVVHLLRKKGEAPERFFAATTLTHSHDRSIHAVADGLVDGAVVHGGVLRRLLAREPGLATRVKEIDRSAGFGMMPIVASTKLPAATREKLRATLGELAADPRGAEAMRALGIDGFFQPGPDAYDTAAAVFESAR
jgi:phosphonate transport system substrate-binding protein